MLRQKKSEEGFSIKIAIEIRYVFAIGTYMRLIWHTSVYLGILFTIKSSSFLFVYALSGLIPV